MAASIPSIPSGHLRHRPNVVDQRISWRTASKIHRAVGLVSSSHASRLLQESKVKSKSATMVFAVFELDTMLLRWSYPLLR